MSADTKPIGLLLKHYDGLETFHPMAHYDLAYRDTAVSETLLYTQADIDAAAAAAVERCMQAVLAVRSTTGRNSDGSTWLMRATRQDYADALVAILATLPPAPKEPT